MRERARGRGRGPAERGSGGKVEAGGVAAGGKGTRTEGKCGRTPLPARCEQPCGGTATVFAMRSYRVSLAYALLARARFICLCTLHRTRFTVIIAFPPSLSLSLSRFTLP
jgi:hypothetical protein